MSENVIQFTILGKDELTSVLKAGAVAWTAFAGAVAFASKAIVDVGAENEKMQVRMTAMLGGVGEANKVFQDMTQFAGEVPFAYDEIMESATTLSGVLRGGSDEINEMMPMIADLAAVSGLSIQQTTDQVVRMYSAGAGAADLFRERGINAMLGFEAGVSVSAEETMRRLTQAFEAPESKFRGAAQELGTTWEGILSMISDKYRAIKVLIADEGLFNFFKAMASQIDVLMGQALENTAENAATWSNFLINSIRHVMDAVAFLANAFRGLQFIWEALRVGFAAVAQVIIEGIFGMAEGVRLLANMIPGIDLGPMETFESILQASRETTLGLADDLQTLAEKEMPSEMIDNFMEQVEITYATLQEKSAESADAQIADQQRVTEFTIEQMNKRIEGQIESYDMQLEMLTEYSQSYEEIFGLTMGRIFENAQTLGESVSNIIGTVYDNMTKAIGRGVADAIVDGKKLNDVMSGILKATLKQIIAMFIEMGVKRLIMTAIFGAASAKEASAALAGGFAQTYTNAFASTAAIPIVGPVLAPGVAAASLLTVQAGAAGAMAAGAATGAATGALHGGLDFVPEESTYLLNQGERVLSPNQNSDLTDFLANDEGVGGGGVTIESLEVHILENATNADALLSMSEEDMEDVVAGPVITALNTLTVKGINPDFIERNES